MDEFLKRLTVQEMMDKAMELASPEIREAVREGDKFLAFDIAEGVVAAVSPDGRKQVIRFASHPVNIRAVDK